MEQTEAWFELACALCAVRKAPTMRFVVVGRFAVSVLSVLVESEHSEKARARDRVGVTAAVQIYA